MESELVLLEFTVRRTEGGELLARLRTVMVLLRKSGDLVFLVPQEFGERFARMIGEQPGAAP